MYDSHSDLASASADVVVPSNVNRASVAPLNMLTPQTRTLHQILSHVPASASITQRRLVCADVVKCRHEIDALPASLVPPITAEVAAASQTFRLVPETALSICSNFGTVRSAIRSAGDDFDD